MKLVHFVSAPFYLVYKLWIGAVFWLTLLVLYIPFRVLLSREKWFGAVFRLKKAWSFLIRVLLFCPLRIRYLGSLPQPPYIIVSNHSSHLDTVFMYSVIPDYFLFIGKGELLKWPLFRIFFLKMDIPVDRLNSQRAYKSLQRANTALDRNECIAIYPEGTIPLTSPVMKSFKNGAFRMAIEKGVPVVPITWQTNYKVLNNPAKLFSPSAPHTIRVVVHPAVYTEGATDTDLIALRNRVHETISSVM